MRKVFWASALVCALTSAVAARAAATARWNTSAPWAAQTAPKSGAALAIGSYAAGCVQGAIALPPSGPGFELLHLGRRRNFGHPALVEYVLHLAVAARARGLPALLVGDLSQPRGGPTPTSHASHQSGLDVDIGYTRPADARERPLASSEREGREFTAVVDLERQSLRPEWNPRIAELLELAASDPAVDRIFVNPVVKRELCRTEKPGTVWLARLRPWWLHHDHFHVRLRCPAGSPTCRPQEPAAPGDGCGTALAWWFSEEARSAAVRRLETPPKARAPALPVICRDLLR